MCLWPAGNEAAERAVQSGMNSNPTSTIGRTVRRVLGAMAGLVALLIVGGAIALALQPADDDPAPIQSGSDDHTATTTTAPPQKPGGIDLSAVAWDSVDYPIDCGPGAAAELLDVRVAMPEPSRQVAVVMAACEAGAGSPPRTVFVYDWADAVTTPHLLQTLAIDGSQRLTERFDVEGASVVATGASYSSSEVPRCCPDGTFSMRWTWSGDGYSPA